MPGYENDVVERAVKFELEHGKSVWICSAEDLIIHKAVAGRAQDIRDIEGVIYRQGSAINADYVRRWLQEFSQAKGDSDLLDLFEQPWARIAGKS